MLTDATAARPCLPARGRRLMALVMFARFATGGGHSFRTRHARTVARAAQAQELLSASLRRLLRARAPPSLGGFGLNEDEHSVESTGGGLPGSFMRDDSVFAPPPPLADDEDAAAAAADEDVADKDAADEDAAADASSPAVATGDANAVAAAAAAEVAEAAEAVALELPRGNTGLGWSYYRRGHLASTCVVETNRIEYNRIEPDWNEYDSNRIEYNRMGSNESNRILSPARRYVLTHLSSTTDAGLAGGRP